MIEIQCNSLAKVWCILFFMAKRIFFIILFFVTVGVIAIYSYIVNSKEFKTIVSPYRLAEEEKKTDESNLNSVFEEKKKYYGDIINILLVGTDTSTTRRAKGQLGFNTDSMILVSVNTKTNKVLLTSVPRDLWINGNKINALYTVYGEETLVDAYEKVTGQQIDGVIRADFDQFRWLMDSIGGVPVNIENSFTDTTFPNRLDSDVETVAFTQGTETMDGWRALTFARSRHGDNGEGSDLMRAKRQHIILKGFVNGINQEKSKFWPFDAEKFFNDIKAQDIYTTLDLNDVKYLWDFYKDKDKYTIDSLVVDGRYVYHPGMYPQSDYTAWVFIAKEPGFTNLHKDIQDRLDGTYIDPDAVIPGTEPSAVTQ